MTDDWHRVGLVIDVCDVSWEPHINKVCPRLILDARQAISDELDRDSGGHLETQKDAFEESEGRTEGLPYCRHGGGPMRGDHPLHGVEHLRRGPVATQQR